MSPSAIIIHFDIFEDFSFRFFSGPKFVPVDQLDFERVKKALCDGIIPAVTLSAHAADKLILSQYRLEIITRVLAATVRMTDKTLRWISPHNSLSHRLRRQRIRDCFIHR